jgi:hypothetical protein
VNLGNAVKLDKLAKQLRRDLLANPKKAGALGLMVLVALYFWAPLVKKWVVPAKSTASAVVAGLILEDEPTDASQVTRSAGKMFRWDKVRELIQKDKRMTSALLDASVLDPFRGVAPKSHEPAPMHEPETQPAPESPPTPTIDPGTAGLVLTSVMIGPQRSTATINGEAHRLGELVEIATKSADGRPLAYRLAHIDRTGIQLEAGGKAWRLELSKPGLALGDEIVRGDRN